jgi:inner membrane protein
MDADGYHEGYYSLFDDAPRVSLRKYPNEVRLLDPIRDDWDVRRLAWFSKGFYGVRVADGNTQVSVGSASTLGQLLGAVETARASDSSAAPVAAPVVMTDLRMGQTPWFVFAFVVGAREGDTVRAVPVQQVPSERPPLSALPWLWHRIWSSEVPGLTF